MPQITIVIGGSFGAGNYGMCGRALRSALHLRLAQRRTAVMGGEQAAGVMEIVTEQKLAARGQAEPTHGADRRDVQGASSTSSTRESTALYATARLWDDGIIDPRDTRRVLALRASSICRAKATLRARLRSRSRFGVARM